MSDDRPIAYRENDISVYRISSVGSCIKALSASMLGYEPERAKFQQDVLDNAAKEGNLHEDAIVEELKKTYGWRVWGGQDVVEQRVIPGVIVRGHIDGICIPKKARNERVLEVKTMSNDRFKKWKNSGSTVRERLLTDDFAKYGWQVSVYMHAYGKGAMYVVKNRNSGELMIEELKLPTVDWKTVKQKIIAVEMWRKRRELPDCDVAASEKFFCPYPYLHEMDNFGSEPADEDSPLDDATNVMLAGMAEHYVEIQRKVATLKPLEDERKELGKKILAAMGVEVDSKTQKVSGLKEVVAGKYELSRVDNTRKYANHKEAAKTLGVTEQELKDALDRSKEPKTYPYVKVKELGNR